MSPTAGLRPGHGAFGSPAGAPWRSRSSPSSFPQARWQASQSSATRHPPETAEPVPGTDEPSGPAEPTLGAEREARALEVIEGDERAQRFLAGRDYELARGGPWTIDSPQGFEVFGADLELRLAEPASYPQQDWPVVEHDAALDPPYRERSLPMAADNVRQLRVLVDLRRDRVVSVEPVIDENIQIKPGPGFPTNPPTGE